MRQRPSAGVEIGACGRPGQPEARRFSEFGARVLQLTRGEQHFAQRIVRRGRQRHVPKLESQRGLEVRSRFRQASLAQQCHTRAVMRTGVIGREPERFLVVRDGAVVPDVVAREESRQGVVRIQLAGFRASVARYSVASSR